MALSIANQIEGLLFYKGEPLEVKELAKMLHTSEPEIKEGISELKNTLASRGLALMEKDDSVALSTAPELSELITKIRKEELSRDLSKASLETLAVIVYKNGATRSEIDYIRGVNSTFILRNLLIRGLVEKLTDERDNRRFIYRPTFELLSFLGVSDIADMPEYDIIKETLSKEMGGVSSESADAPLPLGEEI